MIRCFSYSDSFPALDSLSLSSVTFGALKLFDQLFKHVWVQFIFLESLSSFVHEIKSVKLCTRYVDPILQYLFLVVSDAFHLRRQLILVVFQDALGTAAFLSPVLVVQDGVEDLLAALLTVVDTKADFDVLLGLQLTIGKLLEEFKDDVDVFVWVTVCELLDGSFCLLSSFDQGKELVELDVSVVVDGSNHLLNLFP